MPKLYIATSCVGKTYFCQHTPGWVDLDWYLINKANNEEEFFLAAVTFYQYWGYNILTNSTKSFEILSKSGITIDGVILAGPEMKNEILMRAKNREASISDTRITQLIASIDKNYDYFIQQNIQKILIKPGQYLTDIIDAAGNIKELK